MDSKKKRCIAVDLDQTLAEYEQGDIDKYGPTHIGAPIPDMVKKVKAEIANGSEVFIFSARANAASDSFKDQMDATIAVPTIMNWCKKHLGTVLPIAHRKLRVFDEIWDDRARQVLENTGTFVTELMK